MYQCGCPNLNENIIISNNNRFKMSSMRKGIFHSRPVPSLDFPLFTVVRLFFYFYIYINWAVIFLKPTTQFPLWILLLCYSCAGNDRFQQPLKYTENFCSNSILTPFGSQQYQHTHLNCTLLCIVHAVVFFDYVVVFFGVRDILIVYYLTGELTQSNAKPAIHTEMRVRTHSQPSTHSLK